MIVILCGLFCVVDRFQYVTSVSFNDTICAEIRRKYDGVLMIIATDRHAGFSTAVFSYVTNHILYANMFNLLPWVYFHPMSTGPIFSTTDNRGSVDLNLLLNSSSEIGCRRQKEPNPPSLSRAITPHNATRFLPPHGLWDDYFYPISAYRPSLNCPIKIFHIAQRCVFPGIHHIADWAVRSWKYHQQDLDVFDESWYRSKRNVGSIIVEKYIRPLPIFRTATEDLYFQMSSTHFAVVILGIHARGTDKAAGRRLIHFEEYLKYATAFLSALPTSVTGKIFLASDDVRFFSEFSKSNISHHIYSFNNTKLSGSKHAPFRVHASSRRIVNAEVLKDIVMLSKCDFLVHGHSTVSESAIYMNFKLHSQSVNIEYNVSGRRFTPDGFRSFVAITYPQILFKRRAPSW